MDSTLSDMTKINKEIADKMSQPPIKIEFKSVNLKMLSACSVKENLPDEMKSTIK